MDFKIRVLRYFVTAAEQGSVTRAAEVLHVAQPSLSQRIRTFEDLLGFPLFERSHGTIKLTQQGEIFLPIAKKLVVASDLAGDTVRNLREGNVGTLRVGGSWFNLERVECRRIVDQFTDDFPNVEVIVERGLYSPELLTRLKLGELDVAFVVGPVDTDVFDSIDVEPITFDLLVPEDSPLAELDVVPLKALSGITIAWYRRDNNPHVYDAAHDILTGHGAEFVAPPDTHLSALVHYAQRTGNCTLVGRRSEIATKSMVAIPLESEIIKFDTSLTRLRKHNSGIVEQFWSFAEDQCADDDEDDD